MIIVTLVMTKSASRIFFYCHVHPDDADNDVQPLGDSVFAYDFDVTGICRKRDVEGWHYPMVDE